METLFSQRSEFSHFPLTIRPTFQPLTKLATDLRNFGQHKISGIFLCVLSTLNVLQTGNYDSLTKFNYVPLLVDSFKLIDRDAIRNIFYWLPNVGCINISGFCKLLVILLMYALQSLSQSKKAPFFNISNNGTDDCAKLGMTFLRKPPNLIWI